MTIIASKETHVLHCTTKYCLRLCSIGESSGKYLACVSFVVTIFIYMYSSFKINSKTRKTKHCLSNIEGILWKVLHVDVSMCFIKAKVQTNIAFNDPQLGFRLSSVCPKSLDDTLHNHSVMTVERLSTENDKIFFL